MIVSLVSASLLGVDAYVVDIEIDVSGGLPEFRFVGLAAPAIREGASRVRSALKNCGQELPAKRVTVNLAPADRKKDSVCFDLPIALGLAGAHGLLPMAPLRNLLVLGELGLDGTVRPVRGVLAATALAKKRGLRGVLVPKACAAEAALVPGVDVFALAHLAEVFSARDADAELPRAATPGPVVPRRPTSVDFAQVRGQAAARRAIEVAGAGGHNILFYGPPGIGKTMIARRVPTILPPMSHEEAVEVTKVYSAAGLSLDGLVSERPFRAPHHTISSAALVGGGCIPRPGEISLAHRGVLFLDELPEFGRNTLEVLRQPIEEHEVRIARVAATVRLPAAFHLVAAANPCPCGYAGSERRACTCPPGALERYRARMSGPLLDRIDLQVRVGSVSFDEMRGDADGESSQAIRARVLKARDRQERRLAPWKKRTNAEMSPEAQRTTCRVSADAEKALQRLFEKRGGMSARGLDRIVRVARTIADLDGEGTISVGAIWEAAMYRVLDTDPTVDPRRFLPARKGAPGSNP